MVSSLEGLEVEAISPVAPRTSAQFSPFGRKRRVTPSPEASSSKKILLVTPRGAIASLSKTIDFKLSSLPLPPKCLFQTGEAKIGELKRDDSSPCPSWSDNNFSDARSPLRLPHAQPEPHPEAKQDMPQVNLLPARHIFLPFDLRINPNAWDDRKNKELLTNLFPSDGVGFDGWCLTYWLKVLPPKPWPKTIAGVPCYFTLDLNDHGPIPPLIPAHWGNPRIGQDIDGLNFSNWDIVFHLIKEYFNEVEIPITEVQYWGSFVMIILENRNSDVTKFPNRVANIRCNYLYEDQMGRPEVPQARRVLEPMPGNPDESQYDILGPGLRLASDHDPSDPGAYLRTSAGVLVRDSVGNTFMTAASHGFPSEWGTTIYHPSPNGGLSIGELVMEITHTDVAMVKLNTDKEFANVTFQNDIFTEPMQLRQFVRAGRTRGGIVMLDSPDTGFIEGTLRLSSFTKIPSDNPLEPLQHWIRTTWVYTGQDTSQDLSHGICGSAIWDEDGSVFGFFRYAPNTGVMKDWCAGIAADELMDRGYTIFDPTVE